MKNVLSIGAFYGNVVSVVYDEIIFCVELNISVASIVNVASIVDLSGDLIVDAFVVVNNELFFM